MSAPAVRDILTLTVAGPMAAGGDALGRLVDGRVAFLEGALPGETVTVELVEVRRDFARARVLQVQVAAPERTRPPCPHVARGCGGCPWQHIEPAAQLRFKEGIVTDALRRIARVKTAPQWLPPVTLGDRGYRSTVHLAVTPEGRPAYRRRHAHQLVDVNSCLVAHDRLAELIETVRAPGAASLTLRIGVAGGERLVVLDLASPRLSAVWAPAGAVVVGGGQRAFVHDEIVARRWRISARSFFQSGPAGAAALVDAVDEAVGDRLAVGEVLVDAYAGVGLLGGVVAERRGARLVSLEQHPEAVADARVNLAGQEALVVAGDVARWTASPAAVVIADPARRGLGRAGVTALTATGAARVVLVSCDPASLGRDAGLLADAGYRLNRLRLVDLFPHTVHVETVAVFDRP